MRIEWMPSRDGSLDRVTVVDRRAGYQAKVRNADLHTTLDFRSRYARGLAYKARVGLICKHGVDHALRAALQQLDWNPTHPRPDAPPSPRGSAAA